jgi:hypothetical protein
MYSFEEKVDYRTQSTIYLENIRVTGEGPDEATWHGIPVGLVYWCTGEVGLELYGFRSYNKKYYTLTDPLLEELLRKVR